MVPGRVRRYQAATSTRSPGTSTEIDGLYQVEEEAVAAAAAAILAEKTAEKAEKAAEMKRRRY
eukprot:3671406-Rhodomonas_salina.2